jgi:predicted hydrocarbon binding protein
MTNPLQTCCTSEFGQLMVEGVKGVIGKTEAGEIINLAGGSYLYNDISADRLAFADLTALQAALEERYGTHGGRGIALRAGRVAFSRLLQKYENTLGWDQTAFRIQPTPVRLAGGLKSLANLLGQLTGIDYAVEKAEGCWLLQAQSCPFCWKRETGESACHFLVGLVQEYFTWAGSGKFHPVNEVECLSASGNACVIKIERSLLD